MNSSIQVIPLGSLALAFIPVACVIVIMLRWSLDVRSGIVAVSRMLIQLALIGYLLNWIFAVESSLMVGGIISIMLLVASWIAMRPLKEIQWQDFSRSLFAIAL